ncbi:MAG: hypothetical protein KIS76_18945 [Pyrinomonadaceae bacterium]|nr:hypothetical protein [Pyrinomonadaceae bacterium]
MAQIHSALAYYYAHREELEAEILRRLHEVNDLAAQQSDSPLQKKLREMQTRK